MANAEIISFQKQSAIEIHERAVAAAGEIESRNLALFEVLLTVESRQIYYEFDVPSLRVYCMELLRLSRNVTNDFISVVRKSLEVPELAEAIRGGLSMYKARKICSVLTAQNHRDWIQLALHCSCREVERSVAMANPKAAVQETMKFVSADALEFKLGVSEEWAQLLTRTKDILSQKHKRNVSSEEALFILMTEHCQKNDPVEKARRHEARSRKKAQIVESVGAIDESSTQTIPSRHLPAEIEYAVTLRDQDQCAHVDANGERCEQRRWLAKHHIEEFAQGGQHTPENLITLCWGHHKIVHLKSARSAVVVT